MFSFLCGTSHLCPSNLDTVTLFGVFQRPVKPTGSHDCPKARNSKEFRKNQSSPYTDEQWQMLKCKSKDFILALVLENLGVNDRFHNKEKGLTARGLSKETGGHLIEGVDFEGESIHTWHATDHMELGQLRSKVGLKRHIVEVLVSDLRLAAVLGWREEEAGRVNGNTKKGRLFSLLLWAGWEECAVDSFPSSRCCLWTLLRGDSDKLYLTCVSEAMCDQGQLWMSINTKLQTISFLVVLLLLVICEAIDKSLVRESIFHV